MESRAQTDNRPVHVINIDIQDNHEEATMGAFLICDLVAMVRTRVHCTVIKIKPTDSFDVKIISIFFLKTLFTANQH